MNLGFEIHRIPGRGKKHANVFFPIVIGSQIARVASCGNGRDLCPDDRLRDA
jgi:hypothetical protein